MFRMNCLAFTPGMLEVGQSVLGLQVIDHTPELKKFVSIPYECKEDKLISIVIHARTYERNGFLWDLAYPEIQWRIQ